MCAWRYVGSGEEWNEEAFAATASVSLTERIIGDAFGPSPPAERAVEGGELQAVRLRQCN